MSKEGIGGRGGGGGGGARKGETAPCHKGMGPRLNFDTDMSKKRVVQYSFPILDSAYSILDTMCYDKLK
jgi:hypothetical protein